MDGCLFFGIKGSKHNGLDFAYEAYHRGAKAIVCDKMIQDLPTIYVEDIQVALDSMSSAFFNHPERCIYMIGITGTKGKTTITYLLHKLIPNSGVIGTNGIKIKDNIYECANTTPDAYTFYYYLNKMVELNIPYVFIEMSSQALKYHRLGNICFDIGIITNISYDHISKYEHSDFNDYILSKRKMKEHCNRLIVNGDDELINDLGHIKVSMNDVSDIQFSKPYSVSFKYKNKVYDSNIGGIYNILNSLFVIEVCNELNKKITDLNVRIEGRNELIEYNHKLIMIDYAHNEYSLKKLLENMIYYHYKHIVIVFGCGGNRDTKRRKGMGKIAGIYANMCIITSDNPRLENPKKISEEIYEGIKEVNGNAVLIENRRLAIEFALKHVRMDDILLLVGKGHEKYIEINDQYYEFNEKEIVLEYIDETVFKESGK